MYFKKADSLIRFKERARHKQSLLRTIANPKKSGCAKKTSRNEVALKKLLDRDALLHERRWEFAK